MVALSCASMVHASETWTIDQEAVAKIISHSKDPVKLSSKGINNMEDLDQAYNAYINKHYHDFQMLGGFTQKNDKTFLRYILIEQNGKTISIAFDITECFKKLKSKSKELKAELTELEKLIDPPKTIITGATDQ